MRVNCQTSRTFAFRITGAFFITLWLVLIGGARPLGAVSQNATPEDRTLAKKKSEKDSGKSSTDKINAGSAPSDKQTSSDSKADPKLGEGEDMSKLSPAVKIRAEFASEDRFAALERAMRSQEEAMRSQNEKLDRMQKLIEQQQRTIELLTSKPTAPSVESLAGAGPSSLPTQPIAAERTTASRGQQSGQPQTQQPDRLQKLEETVRMIGPIRWSGDMRLRFDAFFRSANNPPDPPSLHQQNVRMRYRFRLNLDVDTTPYLSFHGQLSTAPANNQLTSDQDFNGIVIKHPFFINEAWLDFHPNPNIQLQAGRVLPIFTDGSLFLFDDDIRFNGFNERFAIPLKNAPGGITKIEFRAGQYIFSNPVIPIVLKGSPLNLAGAKEGSTARSANLFHQGFVIDQKISERWNQQFTTDIQLYRNPNQILLASVPDGVSFVSTGIGLTLSGPINGLGNATTTPGGAIYRAGNFQIGRVAYRINNTGFNWGDHQYPISLYTQLVRNFGTGAHERDSMMTTLQVGKWTKRGDMVFTYFFTIKGANSIIGQFSDEDPGAGSTVNIRAHMIRWDIGLAKNVKLETMAFIRQTLRSSGQYPNFFVPIDGTVPTLYRFQERLLFSF